MDRPLYLGTLTGTPCSSHPSATRFGGGLTAKVHAVARWLRLEQGVLTAGHSHLDAQAEMNNFSNPQWSFRYRGWVELLDFRETLREPTVRRAGWICARRPVRRRPVQGTGSYSGQDIGFRTRFFMRRDSPAAAAIDRQPRPRDSRFLRRRFGGKVRARDDAFDGLQFRADPRADVRLAGVLPSIEHRDFPIDELHWDARVTADTDGNVKRTPSGTSKSPRPRCGKLARAARGTHQPVSAAWKVRYRYDPGILTITAFRRIRNAEVAWQHRRHCRQTRC